MEACVALSVQADLHLHTTASDGRLSPREMIDLTAGRGLKVISITDHDSTEGIKEANKAALAYPDLQVIAGIELSADVPNGEVHILGHFVDYESHALQSRLRVMRAGREDRAKGMVEKLKGIGIELEWQRVLSFSDGGAIGRPHIALAMVEKEYVANTNEAFAKYLGRNGPAYVERERLTPEAAVALIRDFSGTATLAHPRETKNLDKWLPSLKEAGLVGMEVFYGSYTPRDVKGLLDKAKKLDLIPLGGSDYHALRNPNEVEPGKVGPPLEEVDRLVNIAKERRRA